MQWFRIQWRDKYLPFLGNIDQGSIKVGKNSIYNCLLLCSSLLAL